VGSNTIYISGDSEGQLHLFAFDLNGQLKWKAARGPAWTNQHPGARSTPTYDGGRLYIVSGHGKVGCYDAKTGNPVWTKEMKEFGGSPGGWGYAESVLVTRDLAVVSPGNKNAIVALDKLTGATKWLSPGNQGPAHYCSAVVAFHDKTPMIVQGNGGGIFAVHPKDGRVLWQNDFAARNTANCPTPAYADGHVFWANGYGKGAICLKIDTAADGLTATEAWRSNEMDCHHGGFILHEGYIYGNNRGGWACLELKTGKKMWNGQGVGKGSLCFADGMLYTFGENGGQAGLVPAVPDKFEVKGQFRVEGKGPSWAHPVVTGGRLYLRYQDNLYCFDVKQ